MICETLLLYSNYCTFFLLYTYDVIKRTVTLHLPSHCLVSLYCSYAWSMCILILYLHFTYRTFLFTYDLIKRTFLYCTYDQNTAFSMGTAPPRLALGTYVTCSITHVLTRQFFLFYTCACFAFFFYSCFIGSIFSFSSSLYYFILEMSLILSVSRVLRIEHCLRIIYFLCLQLLTYWYICTIIHL